jgi:hypothetical protein
LFAYASFSNTAWFGYDGCVHATKHTAAAAAAAI